jgi:hypothetical protein
MIPSKRSNLSGTAIEGGKSNNLLVQQSPPPQSFSNRDFCRQVHHNHTTLHRPWDPEIKTGDPHQTSSPKTHVAIRDHGRRRQNPKNSPPPAPVEEQTPTSGHQTGHKHKSRGRVSHRPLRAHENGWRNQETPRADGGGGAKAHKALPRREPNKEPRKKRRPFFPGEASPGRAEGGGRTFRGQKQRKRRNAPALR